MTTTPTHRLESVEFTALAGGAGGPEAIRQLHAAQVSKHLLLIGRLIERWPADDAERDRVADALERARTAAPGEFREIIGDPLVGAWAGIVTRAVGRSAAVRADFTHLGAIAAVACAAARVDCTLEVPVHSGLAVLPAVGAAKVDSGDAVRVSVRDGRLVLDPTEVPVRTSDETRDWLPVHRLAASAAGCDLQVNLDDVHPYRHGHHVPPAPRLATAEADEWRNLFGQAWTLLVDHVPDRAGELTAGLRTLVPLQNEERTARSATIRHAFGVFGLTRPPSAAEFAVTTVHEFQHSKLSALLDLVPLTDPDDDGLYFAPWRVDPRPLAGLLQGIYAFAGVADTWRAFRAADGLGAEADAQFAEARLQVDRALIAVEGSQAFTPAGANLIGQLRRSADDMMAESLPAAVVRAAEGALEQTWTAWRDRNAAAAQVGGGSMSPSRRSPRSADATSG